jgi:hypothetical protein
LCWVSVVRLWGLVGGGDWLPIVMPIGNKLYADSWPQSSGQKILWLPLPVILLLTCTPRPCRLQTHSYAPSPQKPPACCSLQSTSTVWHLCAPANLWLPPAPPPHPPGALGGRLDHTLSNLNTLYCYRHLNLTLWGDGNLVRLLRVGTTRIQPSRAEGPTCGLVPLARPATASSTGLKWNLDNTHVSGALSVRPPGSLLRAQAVLHGAQHPRPCGTFTMLKLVTLLCCNDGVGHV